MDKIWKNRAHPDQEPFECDTTHGIRGSVPYDIKREVERAACQTGSPIVNAHNAVVKVIRRTHGDAGCGPGLDKAKTVVISSYTVDCPSVRDREKLGVVAESQVDGIDRPGSDLAPGATAGDGSPAACKAACNLASACKAWTWVPPGQGAASKCWLKSAVPWHVTSPGMVSGVPPAREPVANLAFGQGQLSAFPGRSSLYAGGTNLAQSSVITIAISSHGAS